MKTFLVIFLAIIIIGFLVFIPYLNSNRTDFEQQIVYIPSNAKDLIKVSFPTANSEISSPFLVTGEARGQWYFEAIFPIELLDSGGKSLAVGYATAKTDWMTTELVPFSAEINFVGQPKGSKGILKLKRDNASGLPENEMSVEIPVVFR